MPSSTWPLNPSKISASTPALAGGSQLEGKRWGSGTSFSAAQAGAVYQRQDIPPLLSVSPLRRKSSAVPSTSAKTPAAQPGLDTTSGKAEQGNALDNTTTAAAAARRNSIGMAEGINRSASKAALSTALETHEGEITAVAAVTAASLQQQTQKQKQELRQLHERKHQRGQGHQLLQMPLSSLLSSPALLCRTHSTHQTRGGEPTGNADGDSAGGCDVFGRGGGGGERGVGGNYRSVCSCPTIGVTDTSPLFSRHELTDRSALERSQRLVSWFLHRRFKNVRAHTVTLVPFRKFA